MWWHESSLHANGLLDSGPHIADLGIRLIVHNIAGVIHVVILSEGPPEGLQQMHGDGALGLGGLPVVVAKHWLGSLGGLCQVVVGYLGKEVVHHMGPNVVVDPVEDAVVPVDGGEASSEVAPLLP